MNGQYRYDVILKTVFWKAVIKLNIELRDNSKVDHIYNTVIKAKMKLKLDYISQIEDNSSIFVGVKIISSPIHILSLGM